MKRKERRMIHIWLSEEMHKRLRVHVALEDTDMQHWVASLIERELAKARNKEGVES